MATSWTVTGDNDGQVQITPAGQVITGHLIFFLTGQGNRGQVFVPDDHYRPATVRTLINAQATLADEIGSLAGTTG